MLESEYKINTLELYVLIRHPHMRNLMNFKIKSFIYYIAVFFCLSPFKLFSTTFETNDICDLIPHIHAAKSEDNTLILFDIDDTLIDSPLTLNSGPWISYYWQNVPKLLPLKMPVVEELMWYVSKSIPALSVDQATASVISLCQKNLSLIPLAFTARPIYKKRIDGIQVTADQLININIDFSKTIPPSCMAKHPCFHRGIIFASGKMKGDFLQQYLVSTGYLPNRIIFIDDKLDQIQSVERTMHEKDIKVICFWYRRALQNRSSFNLQLANIQLECLLKYGRVMSDEEAEILLKTDKYASINPEDFLIQLIDLYEHTHFGQEISLR